jgi:hypothetical protein
LIIIGFLSHCFTAGTHGCDSEIFHPVD